MLGQPDPVRLSAPRRYLQGMPSPLISVNELQSILGDNDTRIVDCRWYLGEPHRGTLEYQGGHILGAVYASLDDDLSGDSGAGRHPLPTPDRFRAVLARLGITRSTRVIVYDDRGGAIAARLWWMLTNQGHEMTSVLDGGIQAWIADGLPLSTTAERPPASAGFSAHPWTGTADRDAVAKQPDHTILVDARSYERYVGAEEPIDPKPGHIPGAISLPQADNLTEELAFLSPDVLRSRFLRAGIGEASDVIVHCGSGVTACHNILAMEIAGIRRPLLYVGSWSDWSSQNLPVATGEIP
jgi:thiosulfate/3-mercaptopyruvate sulfurtransferase